ncbi:MAG: hypothetical protein QM228_07270 [Atribacterota bacterium]|nr:hypothetical protein [Atribacterota bacterium]
MTDGVDASLNFRHDGKEASTLNGPIVPRPSTLNGSIPFFVTPAIFKPGSMVLKAFGFLIRDFRHDKKKGVIPEWFYEGSKLFKGKCICIGENIRKHSLLHFKKQATLY